MELKEMILELRAKAYKEGFIPEFLNINRGVYDQLYFEETKSHMIPPPKGSSYYGMKINIVDSISITITGTKQKEFTWI
jgi:hypothetical protein